MKLSRSMKIASVAIVTSLFASTASFAGVSITGAGSTFAGPLIDACKADWQSATGNTVTYSGGGSGTGRKNADAGIGNFNFSDATYTPAKSTIVHIPVVAAPLAIAYHLNSSKQLYLSAKTLSDIFAGNVTMWNDPEIVADNNTTSNVVTFKKDSKGNVVKDAKGSPVVAKTTAVKRYYTLPNQKISVIYRADSSGSTQNLVNMFIKKFPSVWTKASSGSFASVFPGAINGAGNLGRFQSATGSSNVAALIKKTPYSIGYMEASFASAQKLGLAQIQNASGSYQAPDAGGTAAFLSAATASADGKLTFNYETTDKGAYILGIVSYGLVDTAATGAGAVAAKSLLTAILDPKCPATNPALQYTTITGSLLATDKALIAKLSDK